MGAALTFGITLTGINLQDWQELQQVISNFAPTDQNDKLHWN